MNSLFIDMHVHSTYSHDCDTSILAIANKLKKEKLGVSITDHNEIKGSLELAKKHPKLLVIPGIEITSYSGKDILIYFDKFSELKEFYSRHILPNKKYNRRTNKTNLSTSYVIDIAKDYNALVAMPHPFMRLKGAYKEALKNEDILDNIDAIEVLNASKSKKANYKSFKWCNSINKPFVAGSDGHILSRVGSAGIEVKGETPSDVLDQIRNKKAIVFGDSDRLSVLFKELGSIVKNKLRFKKNIK